MIRDKVTKQRCFKIPKNKLDLFLVRLDFDSRELINFEAKYIFQNGKFYDVVVNYYGSYPFVENCIDEFVEEMK